MAIEVINVKKLTGKNDNTVLSIPSRIEVSDDTVIIKLSGLGIKGTNSTELVFPKNDFKKLFEGLYRS